MRYVSFRIRNFRGVEDATVDLLPAGANVFTLIGLNESGKTSVLEAISTFQVRGGEEKSLYQSNPSETDFSLYVPKHEKATFSGNIEVVATIEFEDGDKEFCIKYAEKHGKCKIDPSSIPDRFTLRRGYSFENGDLIGRINEWDIDLIAKEEGKRKFSSATSEGPSWRHFSAIAASQLPKIVYFPTFIFEQPDKIVLNPDSKEKPVEKLYRSIIENAGLSLDKPINVTTNIVERILKPETPGEAFVGLFGLSTHRQQQIDAALNQISYHLSTTVLGSWSRIFGGSTANREVRLRLGTDKRDDGSDRVYVQFSLRDGVQQYDISERSLGFRWFFSFLLFTLFRDPDRSGRKTLFLLDEPASNLHAGAQTQLLESFPRITKGGSMLMYSTHSHYMINPEWLDQAFIVSNAGVDYDDLVDASVGLRHTDVRVLKYRTFVGSNPDKTTYFQPVLDRLQVVPSRLDMVQPAVLVEGKGDFLLLRYGLFHGNHSSGQYAVLPTRGADHFGEIVGILLGWGVNFVLCFDDDRSGRDACKDYRNEWSMADSRVFTLGDVDNTLSGKAVEGFLEASDLDIIRAHYQCDGKPTKSQIQLFFSEKLALREKVPLSPQFSQRVANFDARVRAGLGL